VLSVGLVVDDAIVMVEKRRAPPALGLSPFQAAIGSGRELDRKPIIGMP